MADIVVFKSRAENDAKDNLAAFIELCRSQLTGLGADLPFDSPCWDITQYIARKADPTRVSVIFSRLNDHSTMRKWGRRPQALEQHPELLMRPTFIGFAQAYFRYIFSLRPGNYFSRCMITLRCLDEALAELSAGPTAISPHVLNRATAIAIENHAKGTAYGVGLQLKYIAEFVNSHHLVSMPFSWTPSTQPTINARTLGPEAAKAREDKMPSQAALEAIADIFHIAEKPRDVVTSGVVGCLLSAPMRIHELLLVPNNCWIDMVMNDGKPAFGLRWRPGKGAEPAPKWLNSAMASVATLAISRIRTLTENARKIATWYENHPTQLYLPPKLEHLREKALTADDVAALIGATSNSPVAARNFLARRGLRLSKRIYNGFREAGGGGTIPFSEVEAIFLEMLPAGFPWAHEGFGLRYSELLFIIELNGLSDNYGTCPVMFQSINRGMIARDISVEASNIFSRHNRLDGEGNPLRMKTHQARHLLDTIALVGGMTQLDVAKWSGRKDVRQNDAYDHRTPAQMLEHIRDSVGDSSRFRGPLASLPKNVPISRRDFALQSVPNAHITELGWCIHDYTESPCGVFNDCISCREQVCIKGEHGKNNAARSMLEMQEDLLTKARVARANEEYGAAMWEQHHAGQVMKLRELIAIYDDPTIPTGTVIQLAEPSSVLPDRRAASSNPALEHK